MQAQAVSVDIIKSNTAVTHGFSEAIDVFVGWNQTCQKILHVQTSLFCAEIDF